MKRIAIIAASLLICVAGYAQNEAKCKEDWKQKMMSEKIAFLTMELNLTPEEAQVFWPVYNLENKEADKAIGNTILCYRALAKALEEGIQLILLRAHETQIGNCRHCNLFSSAVLFHLRYNHGNKSLPSSFIEDGLELQFPAISNSDRIPFHKRRFSRTLLSAKLTITS